MKDAQLDLDRYQNLVTQGILPKQQLDTQRATADQAAGALRADQGQIDSARLNLTYARITAPLTGRVGLRLVDPGNIVHATDQNGLVVITQLDPIAVLFTIPEDSLPQLLQQMRSGRRLTVDAYDRDLKKKLATGTLLTIDNQIDLSTGTVKLKATFAEPGPARSFPTSSSMRVCSSTRFAAPSSCRAPPFSAVRNRRSSTWSSRTTPWKRATSRSA